jgi:hypothetical protein
MFAQINISKLIAPMDSPLIKEFYDFLTPVNRLAEESKGFVWRLTDESGNAALFLDSPFSDDPHMIVNMSVWETMEDLKAFTFDTVHRYFLQNRKKWMTGDVKVRLAIWEIPDGHIPNIEEGREKLRLIAENGATKEAFDFAYWEKEWAKLG